MRRTKHVIAVMVVATALCADRSAVAASPASARPQASSSSFARSFATRLTRNFGQSVAPLRMLPTRSMEQARPLPLPINHTARGARSDFSPFHFRLPPPSL
jgi:hypothetical protein